MAKTQIIAEPGVPQIVITREFAAPRELLFRAHVEPDLLVQWLGPRQLTLRVDRFEARDGGVWRFVHRDADGNEYGFHGCFHEVRPSSVIVQTFTFEGVPDGVALEKLRLEDLGNGRTRLVATSLVDLFEDRDAFVASGMEQGVKDGYEKLDELLASSR